jgi:hypothetical protein
MYTNPYLAPPVPTYVKGGSVASRQKHGLEAAAEQLRQRGRNGDTILAHINPQEARMLKAMGGSGTINPATGLPEFGFFKKLIPKEIYNPISSIGKELERGVESIAKNDILGPIAQIAAAYFGGPIGAALYAGLAPPGSSFDTKRAATAAALTYGTQQLMNAGAPTGGEGAVGGGGFDGGGFDMAGMGTGVDAAAGVPGMGGGIAALTPPPTVPSGMPIPSSDVAVSSIPGGSPGVFGGDVDSQLGGFYGSTAPPPGVFGGDVESQAGGFYGSTAPPPGVFGGDVESQAGGFYGGSFGGANGNVPIVDIGTTAPTDQTAVRENLPGTRGFDPAGENIMGSIGTTAGAIGDTLLTQALQDPKGTLTAAYLGYTAVQTKEELERQREEAERILRDRENKTREQIEFAESVLRDYPLNYKRLSAQDVERYGMAGGGLASLTSMAKGGMPPRYLRGGGDGMSDSIPARIAGKQEARLADGEFVIPADVVSHLGNGSSNAGAKKLYAMMDRARQARTGKKRQAPAMKAERVMPV